MSRQRSRQSQQPQQPRDVTQFWGSRGYRPELANVELGPGEDPKGEVAYQRAFAEAAKKDPPRLPNPSHYPNSQSARIYLEKRNEEFYQAPPVKRPNPEYHPPIPDMYSRQTAESRLPANPFRDPDASPVSPQGYLPGRSRETSGTPPSHHSQQSISLAPQLNLPSYQSNPNATSTTQSQFMPSPIQSGLPGSRLSVMEPSFAPKGPARGLR